MNSYLDIIPTPKTCEYTMGGTLKIKNVCIKGEESLHLLSALGTISTDYTLTKESCADLIIAYDDHSFKSHFCDEETLFFAQKYATEQGYIIKKDEDNPIIIGAKTDIGCMYALMTLVQILDKNLKRFKITDYPDFKLRGNTWTIWAESGGWSFDFGDGVDAIKSRIKRFFQ